MKEAGPSGRRHTHHRSGVEEVRDTFYKEVQHPLRPECQQEGTRERGVRKGEACAEGS